MAEKKKVFKDPIHGTIELHPLLVKIIDTPQFQRLRNIKQLGAASYIYPGATHSRFDHSIGVAYLAGELLKSIREKQQDLGITDWDVLCVQIAALCHDLGHGPFSHMFDEMFIPKTRPGINWTHEAQSKRMFDHLMGMDGLRKAMKDALNELDVQQREPEQILNRELVFIKELIDHNNQTPPIGRTGKKVFLYDIVSNQRNKIDVDKWDYFARDCHYLGMKNSFDHERLIKSARVCEVDGEWQICYRDKEVFNLYDMFYTRFSLHKRAYKHKVTTAIHLMINDAFLKADEHIWFEDHTLSTAIDNIVAYTKLTDTVFDQILNSTSQTLREARDILKRIVRRDLYHCLGEFHSTDTQQVIEANWNAFRQLDPNYYIVHEVLFNYGRGPNDPISDVRFYKKKNPKVARPMIRAEVSHLLPERFEERLYIIYSKRSDQDLEADIEAFRNFRRQ